jgi:hypothetical protein
VVKHALERDADARFKTAAEMLDALEAAVRPASAKDVAKLVNELAGAHVKEMREAVRGALVEPKTRRPESIAAGLAQPAAVIEETPAPLAPTVRMRPIDPADLPERPAEPRSRALPIAIVAIVIGAALGMIFVRMKREEPPQPAFEQRLPALRVEPVTVTVEVEEPATATQAIDRDEAATPKRRAPRRDRNKLKPKFQNPYTK